MVYHRMTFNTCFGTIVSSSVDTFCNFTDYFQRNTCKLQLGTELCGSVRHSVFGLLGLKAESRTVQVPLKLKSKLKIITMLKIQQRIVKFQNSKLDEGTETSTS